MKITQMIILRLGFVQTVSDHVHINMTAKKVDSEPSGNNRVLISKTM